MKFVRIAVVVMMAVSPLLAIAQSELRITEVRAERVDKTVTVSGTIHSFKESNNERTPYSFMLADNTGEIRVAIWPDLFTSLPYKAAIKNTARATITGTVAEYRGKIEIHVKDAAGIVVMPDASMITPVLASAPVDPRAPAPEVHSTPAATGPVTNISDVSQALVDRVVTIQGKVSSVRKSRSSSVPHVLKLHDGTGMMDVVFWSEDKDIETVQVPHVGDEVRVTGKVDPFKNALQIRLKGVSDIVRADSNNAGEATPVKGTINVGQVEIGSITSDHLDHVITITGEVASAKKPRSETAPYVIKINDGSGMLDVVFWPDLAEKLVPGQKAEVGHHFQVTGKLGEHRGTLQLKLEDVNNLKPVSAEEAGVAAPRVESVETTASRITLSQLASAPAKSRVQLSGTVTGIKLMRFGKRLTLSDGRDQIEVLLWDTAEGLKTEIASVKISSQVTLNGTVEETAGMKVLTVTKPEDVIQVAL